MLFSNNYEYLNTVATRITRSKDRRMAPDLLSETYLNIHDKEVEFPQENDEFVKWFSKCMKNYFIWPNSSFNKIYNFSKEARTIDSEEGRDESRFESKHTNSYADLLIDEDAQRNIYLQCEQTNDFTKELLSISSCIGKVKALKYTELIDFKGTLPPHENILFELYFEKELSTRDIAALYSDGSNQMSRHSVNKMINNIKSKLNNHKWYNL